MTRSFILSTLGVALMVAGCFSVPEGPEPLEPQLRAGVEEFFDSLEGRLAAKSGLTLFIPANGVHPRQRARFQSSLDSAIRASLATRSYVYRPRGEDVFLLSEVRPDDFAEAELPLGDGTVFANGFRAGTQEGWLAFHAFGAYLNRLAVGDVSWIESLPESFRAQLSQSIEAVLRVKVSEHTEVSRIHHLNRIDFDLIETGSQRLIHHSEYEVRTPYSLQ